MFRLPESRVATVETRCVQSSLRRRRLSSAIASSASAGIKRGCHAARHSQPVSADRRGSVLLVVIGLLSLLLVVGFTFFTFADQEQSSAKFNADAAKNVRLNIDSDYVFNHGMRQLIVGPRGNEVQSALYPGHLSLVPNSIGPLDVAYNPGTNQATITGIPAPVQLDAPYGPLPPGWQGRYLPRNLHPYSGGQANLGTAVIVNAATGVRVVSLPFLPGFFNQGTTVSPLNRPGGQGAGIRLVDGFMATAPGSFPGTFSAIIGFPYIDQDGDGIPEIGSRSATVADNRNLLFINRSPAATMLDAAYAGVPTAALFSPRNLPAPNPGYTYPDINSLFLAVDSWATLSGVSESSPGLPQFIASGNRRIIKPSFHWPAGLRSPTVGGSAATAAPPILDWYENGEVVDGARGTNNRLDLGQHSGATLRASDPYPNVADLNNTDPNVATTEVPIGDATRRTGTGRMVLRPHPDHIVAASLGIGAGTRTGPVRRFLSQIKRSYDRNTATYRNIQPFPFATGGVVTTGPANLAGVAGGLRQGVWDYVSSGIPGGVDQSLWDGTYKYDVDNDNDGTAEGIWLDVDYPPFILPDGRISVPLVSYTVRDLDGLLNANTASNLAAMHGTSTLDTIRAQVRDVSSSTAHERLSVSRSNLAVSPSEINPYWAFLRAGTPSTTVTAELISRYEPYRNFFYTYDTSTAYTRSSAQTSLQQFNLANMDLLFLNWGRPQYSVNYDSTTDRESYTAPTSSVEGRWTSRTASSPDWIPLPQIPNQLFGGEFTSGNSQYVGTGSGQFVAQPGVKSRPLETPPYGYNHGLAGTITLFADDGDDDGDRFEGMGHFVDLNPDMVPVVADSNARLSQPLGGYVLCKSLVPWNVAGADRPEGLFSLRSPASRLIYNDVFVPFMGFGHPLDYTGAGTMFYVPTATSRVRPLRVLGVNNASGNRAAQRWLQYGDFDTQATSPALARGYQANTQYQFALNGMSAGTAVTSDLTSTAASSMADSTNAGNIDEPDEMIAALSLKARFGRQDQIFGPDETAGNHLSASDIETALGGSRRLASLMPHSFGQDTPLGNYVRSMFTTESWDRRQHSWTPDGRRPWEWGTYISGGTTLIGDYDGNGLGEFPPTWINSSGTVLPNEYGLAGSSAAGPAGGVQPIRLAVRTVLEVEPNNITPNRPRKQERLNLNKFAVALNATRTVYRDLTPHPDLSRVTTTRRLDPTNTDPAGGPAPYASFPYNPGAGVDADVKQLQQESWARRDRQQLARDIYTLLYVVGLGREIDPIINPTTSVYTPKQLETIAQFAVNYVDALDPDNNVTAFEYDTYLTDGWNMDDNPDTAEAWEGAPTTVGSPAGQRAVVFGVEAQTLSLSEIVSIRWSGPTTPPSDLPNTPWDDTSAGGQGRAFMFVELQNLSPNIIDLSSGNWRLVLRPAVAIGEDPLGYIYLRPVYGASRAGSAGSIKYKIEPGEFYVLGGTYSPSEPGRGANPSGFTRQFSDLRIDMTNSSATGSGSPDGSGYEMMVPATDPFPGTVSSAEATWIRPASDLDLMYDGPVSTPGVSHFAAYNGTHAAINANPESVLSPLSNSSLTEFRVTLERRQTLTQPGWLGGGTPRPSMPRREAALTGLTSPEDDNNWVRVDEMKSEIRNVSFSGTDLTNVPGFLARLQSEKLIDTRSFERAEALYRGGLSEGEYNAARAGAARAFTPWVFNSIGQTTPNAAGLLGNSRTQAAYAAWQAHFDRDLASALDLLQIPLYGPSDLSSCFLPDGFNTAGVNMFGRSQVFSPTDGSATYFIANAGTGEGVGLTAQRVVGRPTSAVNFPTVGSITETDVNFFANKWYRLLDLVEVPSRSNTLLEARSLNRLDRVPGKVNLNTIRHPDVLMGLLDDARIINPNQTLGAGNLADKFEGGRNWWNELVQTRDQVDPISGMSLPGTAVSRPFRPLTSIMNNVYTSGDWAANRGAAMRNGSIESTVLRGRAADLSSTAATFNGVSTPGALTWRLRRQMFSAAQTDEAQSGITYSQNLLNDVIDSHTAARLQAKLANSTTVRSNVFGVWMSVGFFEGFVDANDPTNRGFVQIGDRLTDSTSSTGAKIPLQRVFFIVDRSQLEEAVDPATRWIDWEKLVIYRKRLDE